MSRDVKPVIVKRVKRVESDHHGGAWKVAYADFVTAMMAFFLLMWLISSTTEEQRKGIADYFSPNLALPASTTGGAGPFGGSSMLSDDSLARDEATSLGHGKAEETSTDQAFWEIEDTLLGGSGDANEADPLLRHVRTRITDEGLIIEIFELEASPLYDPVDDGPLPVLDRLVALIGHVVGRTANPIAVTGHLGAPLPEGDPWLRSTARAQVVRQGLAAAGVAEPRFARITGKADREPATSDPADPRNRRVEITLLRRFKTEIPR